MGCFIVTQDGGSTNDTWEWIADLGTNTIDGNAGFAIANSDGAGSGVSMDEILSSPVFDASTISGALILEFDQYYRSLSDVADVDVWDGTQWVNILNQTTTQGAWGTPDHQYIDVTAHANANFQVRFHYYNANYAWYWGIDNFSLTELSCGLASALDTGMVDSSSAVLQWTSNGTLWNIEWGPQGFLQGSGSTGGGNVIRGVTSNPFLLTGLGADSCYDFYVQDSCTGLGTGAWAGPFTFCTKPTCPAPTDLGVDPAALTINSADVYFTPGYATNYEIQYGSIGFTLGSGNTVTATNDTVTLSSLTAGTGYEFYVRDLCSTTDSSAWAGPVSFVTPFTTNYLQDFNTSPPFAWGEADGRLTTNTTFTSTTSSTWGNANFANTGSNGSQRVNIYTSAQYEWLISPSIYLDPAITNLQAEFDAAMTQWISTTQGYFGADDSLALVISTDNGATWSSSDIIWYHDVNDTLDATTGEHFIIPLTGYSGYVRFGFYAGSVIDDTPDNDWFVDNFEVRTPRSCTPPTALKISNVKTDSALVSWTEGTTGFINAEVYYTVGNQPASAGTLVNSTNDSVWLTGLTNATNYCVYVVEQCPNGFSDTLGPVCFNTLCLAQSLPYIEDFNNSMGCFTAVDSSQDASTWMWMSNYGTASNIDGSPGFMMVDSDDAGSVDMDEYAYSPEIDASGLTTADSLIIEFDQYWRIFGGTAFEVGDVDVFDGTNWVTVFTQDESTGNLGAWGAPDNVRINITAYANANLKIRLHYYDANFDYWWAVDNFSVFVENVSCPAPGNVAVANLNCDSAEVSWTSDPLATSSYIEYGPKGYTLGSGTVVPNVSSPYTINGLALNTEYDVYVADSCTMDASTITGPTTFKTDSVGPVLASFVWTQSDTNLVDAIVDYDGSASTGDGLTYSWDFGNSNTGTGASTSATYTSNQGYTVQLTVTDRCGNTDDTTITVNVTHISIAENVFNAGIDVYPNPSEGNFSVRVSGAASDYSIEVTDLSGKVIYKKAGLPSDAEQNINLGDVAQGVYIVRFSGEGLNASQRIIVD